VVTIPPLRERAEDIPLLAEHFARGMTRELGREVFRGFTAAALDRLMAYRWPGNVRELKNVVERSLYRWPRAGAPIDDIVFDAFASPHRPRTQATAPAPTAEPAASGDFLARVAAYEQKLLNEALAANHFNQRRTAAALGLTYDQLRHHLKKHALRARR
jgi:psp operon transcriptional activator